MALVFVVGFADQVGIAHGDTTTAFTFQAAFFFGGGFELQIEEVTEGLCHMRQRNTVLRAFRPGEAGFDTAHVQRQGIGEHRLLAGIAPQALSLGVGLDQLHGFCRAA